MRVCCLRDERRSLAAAVLHQYIHECDVQQSHHVWDKRKLHGLEIALMIIFTVAETSSFVGMTKGFAAAEDISDRCAIRSRGAPSSSYFFFRPNSSTYHFAFQKLGQAVLDTIWQDQKKCLVLLTHCGMRDKISMFFSAVFKNLIFLCS